MQQAGPIVPGAVTKIFKARKKAFTLIETLVTISVISVLVGVLTDYVFGEPTAVRYSLPIVAATSSAIAGIVLVAGLAAGRRAISMSSMTSFNAQ